VAIRCAAPIEFSPNNEMDEPIPERVGCCRERTRETRNNALQPRYETDLARVVLHFICSLWVWDLERKALGG